MADVDPEILARAHEAVEELVEELRRVGTVSQQLTSAQGQLQLSSEALSGTASATLCLVERLEMLAIEIAKLQPALLANQLSDFREEISSLANEVRAVNAALARNEANTRELLEQFKGSAEAMQAQAQAEEARRTSRLAGLSETITTRVVIPLEGLGRAQARMGQKVGTLTGFVIVALLSSLFTLVLVGLRMR
jgi:DNA repair ATPase RecN